MILDDHGSAGNSSEKFLVTQFGSMNIRDWLWTNQDYNALGFSRLTYPNQSLDICRLSPWFPWNDWWEMPATATDSENHGFALLTNPGTVASPDSVDAYPWPPLQEELRDFRGVFVAHPRCPSLDIIISWCNSRFSEGGSSNLVVTLCN